MSSAPNPLLRTPPPSRAVPHPVWSLTLPAWASAPTAQRRTQAAPWFAAARARLRRRRAAEPIPAADPAERAA